MTALIGALCMALVFFGGGIFNEGYILMGLGVTGLGAIGLGVLFAALEAGPKVERWDSRKGLTVNQLVSYLAANAATVNGDTKIYLGDQGFHIAGAVFACVLDGGRTLVIERQVEERDIDKEGFDI